MIDKPLGICSKETCKDCTIHSKIACHVNFGHLFRFYLIVSPAFILGGTGVYNYSVNSFISWVMIIGLFFLLFGIRVLCTHCPHYNESTGILKCWVNYGVPKLWKYRPNPMNVFEKAIYLTGHGIIWAYPIIFISLTGKWILLSGYMISVLLFFLLLSRFYCRKCLNFSCPLNRVSTNVKEEFLKNNRRFDLFLPLQVYIFNGFPEKFLKIFSKFLPFQGKLDRSL